MSRKASLILLTLLAFAGSSAHAQISNSMWGQGGIRIGDSTTTCDAAAEGSIKYNDPANVHQFCNGSVWANIASGGAAGSDRNLQFNSSGMLGADASLVFTSAGNLGIGTATPAATLHAQGATADASATAFQVSNSGADLLYLRNDGVFWSANTLYFAGGAGIESYSSGAYIHMTTGGTSPGNILIDTSSSNGTEKYILLTGGNVGIGTASPSAKLSVAGNITGTGTLTVDGLVTGKLGANFASVSGNETVIGDKFSTGGISTSGGNIEVATLRNGGIGAGTGAYITLKDARINSIMDAGNLPRLNLMSTGTSPMLSIGSGGSVGIGTTAPSSSLHVPDGKYIQAEDNNAGPPPAADCDADAERGRLSIDTTNHRLYICNGATRGWDHIALTD